MSDDQNTNLETWVNTLSDELATGLTIDEESMHIILDLARDAAHEVLRPAAPLTTFLVGVAVGRGTSLGAAAARATEVCLSRASETQPETVETQPETVRED
ncbi:DUF6457 domain-containing protein [Granulicoccus sp. GXG6511]|uniref:DUF6457 domain-containing protein n=1 Tax=Granulicoccus sp. GXG6511 TaxID=3381351 RepID=UPI003D7D9393